MAIIAMAISIYAFASIASYKTKVAKLESEKADVEERLGKTTDTLASFKEAMIAEIQADEYSNSIRRNR